MPLRPLTLLAAALGLLLPVLVSPLVLGSEWSVRYAALAVILAAGVPTLFALLRSPTRGVAGTGLLFAAWAWISAAASPLPTLAVWGLFLNGTGTVFVTALVAAWAIGARVSGSGDHALGGAVLVGAAINCGIAFAQTAFDLGSMHLALIDDRAPGLMGNPVFLGSLLAGASWIALERVSSSRWWLVLVVFIGVGLQLSGSRASIALVVLALAVWAATRGWRPASLAALAVAAGMLLGGVVAHNRGAVSGTERLTDQAAASGGLSMRVATWATAPAAIRERPLLGAGPGLYGAATSPLRTKRLAAIAPDQYYTDAHNLLVEYAVTTGLPGLGLLLLFLGLALRRARLLSPLGGFAVLVLIGHLLQPQHVALTPLALLALGGARRPDDEPVDCRSLVAARLTLGAAAFIAAGVFLVGTFHLEQGRLDFDATEAKGGMALTPPWPEPRTLLARIYTFDLLRSRRPEDAVAARRWSRAAVDHDRLDPRLWNNLADLQASDGLVDEAARSYARALELDPWSVRALRGQGKILVDRGRTTAGHALLRRAASVAPPRDAKRERP